MNYGSLILYIAIIVTAFNVVGLFFCFSDKYGGKAKYCFILSIITQLVLITTIWADKNAAPLQTMGETRIWYILNVSIIGLLIYIKYKIRWINIFTALMALIFYTIILIDDDIISTPIPPILHSVWYIPHVSLYMISYSIFGYTAILSTMNLIIRNNYREKISAKLLTVGTICLTLGMLLGSVWAYSAWSSFWSWDIKESLALTTWLTYIICLHLAMTGKSTKWVSVLSIIGFFLLQICWWGINYIPTYNQSNHIY